jgi:branched-subunit amino acid aminotransferase/4-amino-4-deoxychorismate lyase
MPQPIAWIGDPSQPPERGQWGRPNQLSLPLDDRGLTLADGLFETVLVEQGQARLLEAHLERWRRSAALLGMEPPPNRQGLEPLIAAALERSQAGGRALDGALRLNWSRGSAPGRGIDLPAEGEPPLLHRFWLLFTPLQPSFLPVTVWISQLERRLGASVLSQCKTFAYGQAIQARREARSAGAEEALLLGTAGELCCGATANLLVCKGGTWLTPPLASGCLPGVMRGRALELGLVREATLDPGLLFQPINDSIKHPTNDSINDPTKTSVSAALLLNSLGCRPIRAVNGQAVGAAGQPAGDPGWAGALAESFWRSLLA